MYPPRTPPGVFALFEQALAAHQAGRLQQAETLYRHIAAQGDVFINGMPLSAIVYYNLGLLLQDCGRLPEAEAAYRQSLALRPDSSETHYNLGNVLQALGRLQEAEAAYRKVLDLQPDYVDALNNLGNVLRQSGQLDAAITAYRRVIVLRPDSAVAQNNLGNVFRANGHLDEAEKCYRHALVMQPDFVDAHHNLGLLLEQGKRFAEAEAAYRHALALQPNLADVHHSLGNLQKKTGQLDDAERSYCRALHITPDFPEARCSLSLLRLSIGRYRDAWRDYESRYDARVSKPAAVIPRLAFPQWQGQTLTGKSLLLLPEQGFGDYIQFCRYAIVLKERGLRSLTLGCPPVLKPLLETVAGVDAVVTNLAAVSQHDYWALPLSVPLHCATTLENLPATLPYLHPLAARVTYWQNQIPCHPSYRLRVGVVWKGDVSHNNDANRSLSSLRDLAPLWQVAGVLFVSLQKGQGEDDVVALAADQPLVALGAGISDFADTAAIISQLDLIISVDTAVAHLAGALNKPCWVLLPDCETDWRWMREREDSPWYPGVMRLFRQQVAGDWYSVVVQVAAALQMKAAALSDQVIAG